MITNVAVLFFSVEPGHYKAVPSTMDSGLEKEFLLRIFSPSPLQDIWYIDNLGFVISNLFIDLLIL